MGRPPSVGAQSEIEAQTRLLQAMRAAHKQNPFSAAHGHGQMQPNGLYPSSAAAPIRYPNQGAAPVADPPVYRPPGAAPPPPPPPSLPRDLSHFKMVRLPFYDLVETLISPTLLGTLAASPSAPNTLGLTAVRFSAERKSADTGDLRHVPVEESLTGLGQVA